MRYLNISPLPFVGFTYGSWSFHGYVVDIQPRLDSETNTPVPLSLEVYKGHNEFQLREVITRSYSFYYGCCPEPYPLIHFSIRWVTCHKRWDHCRRAKKSCFVKRVLKRSHSNQGEKIRWFPRPEGLRLGTANWKVDCCSSSPRG